MKKLVSSMFALFGFAVFATAQTVTVADVEALPGQTVSAVIELEAPADTYTGVQFALQFPATGFSVAATGAASGWVGSIEYNTVSAGKVKFAAAGSKAFTEAAIAVEFTVDGSLALNDYDVTVTDIVFEGTGGNANVADVPFKVTVTDRLTLDETATVAPAAATGINVKVKRSIKAGEWSTICLPFAMNKSQADAAFGSGYVVKQYTGYTATIDESTLIPSAITVNFSEYTLNALRKIQPGTPYLIKTTKDIESFDVDGVNILTDLNDVSGAETNYGLTGMFKGVLAKTTVPNNGLFISDNKFYYSNGNTNIKAFRGWFNLEAVLNVAVGAPVFMNIDGETTGIENIQRTAGDDRYYNLNGQHVENLKKGQIYIKNNKKVVVK